MRIEVGDGVTVELLGDATADFDGTVLHLPQATGDAWIIETENSIVYVQTYAAIWKIKEPR